MSPRTSRARFRCAFLALFAAAFVLAPVHAFAQDDTLVVDPGPPAMPVPNRLANGAEGLWFSVPYPATAPAAISRATAITPRLNADLGAREDHTVVFDSVHGRFIAFGGTLLPGGTLFNDVWVRPAGTTPGEWTLLAVAGTKPAPRQRHSAVYDPIGDRMLVFGGTSPLQNDVWELKLAATPTWNLLEPTGTPPTPRAGQSAVFDVLRNRMIVFGGETPMLSNETWFLDLTTSPPNWQLAPTAGTPPAARVDHVAILDTGRDQMIVYAGFGATNYQDVWKLSLGASPTWTRIGATSSPGARNDACGVYDGAGGNLVVFAGRNFSTYYYDVWRLHLADMTWSSVNAVGPKGRFRAAIAIDPTSGVAVVSGGESSALASLDETWALATSPGYVWSWLGTGSAPPPPSPPPPPPPPPGPPPNSAALAFRYGAAGVFDPVRSRFLMLGGAYNIGTSSTGLRDDVVELKIGRDSTWVTTATSVPYGARYGHSAIYDPVRDRILVFGGYNGAYLNDLWQVQLAPSLTITALTANGSAPGPRDFPSAVYDPDGDRILYFGGNNGHFLNDLWQLSLSGTPTWSLITPIGTPPPARFAHCAALDPDGHRMIVGFGYGGVALQDLWALSLTGTPRWSQLSPTGAIPAQRYAASLVHDRNRHRLVLYGGIGGTSPDFDVWELPLNAPFTQWQELAPGGGTPIARYSHLALVDPVNDRMLISGGYGQPMTLSDVWRLQWFQDAATATDVSLLSSDVGRDAVSLKWGLAGDAATFARLERRGATTDWHTIESGPVSGPFVTFVDREVVAGGRYAYRLTVIAGKEVSTSAEVWIDVPAGPSFSLAGFSPNPATREARVAFSLADRAPASIDVVDLGGRRVASRRIDSPTPGAQTIAIAPQGGLSPGLYFVRLTQGSRTLTVRGTVMR